MHQDLRARLGVLGDLGDLGVTLAIKGACTAAAAQPARYHAPFTSDTLSVNAAPATFQFFNLCIDKSNPESAKPENFS
jgi:hypothetical protein